MLRAYGAPESMYVSRLPEHINALSGGHPVLIVAGAAHLARHNWQMADDVLADLLGGHHAAAANEETIQQVLSRIEEPDSKDLLYRLALIIGRFTYDDVSALAAVDPVLVRPRELVARLSGPWIQSSTGSALRLSPLISALGPVDQSPATVQQCHLILGERLVGRKSLSSWEASIALAHFAKADQHERAAVLLLVFLDALRHEDPTADDAGLCLVWAALPLPSIIDLGLRIHVRVLQICVRQHRGLSSDYLLADLDRLLEQVAEEHAWAVVAAAAHLAPDFASLPLLRTLRLLPAARLPSGEPLVLPEEAPVSWVIWALTPAIRTEEQREAWLDAIASFPVEQRHLAFSGWMGEEGCLNFANRVWLPESHKPDDQQEWSPVLAALSELARRAQELGLALLWASAVRARLVVLSEYCHALEAAAALAERALAEDVGDNRVTFLLTECLGLQYIYNSRPAEGLIWLERALALRVDAYPYERLIVLLAASKAAGAQDPLRALQYAEHAVVIAKAERLIPECERVRAFGELAIARWLMNDLSAAFDPLEQGANRLLACKTGTDTWRDLFVLYGHTAGFLASSAAHGAPPAKTPAGQPFAPPVRGMFLPQATTQASLYKEGMDCYLPTQLVMYAQAIARDEEAAIWIERGIALANAEHQRTALVHLKEASLPQLLLAGQYGDAFAAASDMGRMLAALAEHIRHDEGASGLDLDVEAILGSEPNELWLTAEGHTEILILLPLVFQIAKESLGDRSEAASLALEAATRCRLFAASCVGPQCWVTAATLFDIIAAHLACTAVPSLSSDECTTVAQDSVLQVIMYLGTTLQPEMPVDLALSAHLHVMPYVSKMLSTSHAIYRRIVLSYLIHYWSARFNAARFQFRSPRIVADEIARLPIVSVLHQAQVLLNALATALDLELAPALREWLHDPWS